MKHFIYLVKTLTNQNSTQQENRLNSGNACYNRALNLLSSSLLSKHIKTELSCSNGVTVQNGLWPLLCFAFRILCLFEN
jgi:hypothetical protein